MELSFDGINWLAVIVAAVAYFAIGAVWYAPPVFGKIWGDAGGFALPERGEGPSPAIYVVPLVGSLLSAIVLALLAEGLEATDLTAADGLVLGLAIAVGFAIPISLVTATFETQKPKPMVWGAVNAGYHVVGNIVAGLIIGAFG